MATFDHARIKLDRAKYHINMFKAELQSYLDTKPFLHYEEEDPNSTSVHTKFRFRHPIPAALGAPLGDAIHNLRSTLDFLIYEASIDHPDFVEKGTGFPIQETETEYRKAAKRQLRFTSDSTKELVTSLKPYNTGDALLWRLHHADNTDKHRLLIPVGAMSGGVMPNIPNILGVKVELNFSIKPADPGYPLKDGDTLFSDHSGSEETDLSFQPKFLIDISFGTGLGFDKTKIETTLQQLIDKVDEVCIAFEAL